jgi:hypothetical protein
MTKKKSSIWEPPAAFVEYLEKLVDNNLLDKDGSCYKRYERRSIHTICLLENTFTVMEQQRMQPSEWYQSEYSYSDASMNMLKTVFGA